MLDEKKIYFTLASPMKMQYDPRNERIYLDASFHDFEPEKLVLNFKMEKNEKRKT